ncbi:hypothetical protein, partial [Paraburkholderia franconis]|uniref:hypothetical protein n=1 Tax=Paraburkholderia franconis TaxID=2654983 RepID=UPI001D103903
HRAPSSSTHICRLLVFKEHRTRRLAFVALLHQQQRNEIMKNLPASVNRFFTTEEPADPAGKPHHYRLSRLSRFPRAAVSAARKSGILGACHHSCKRFFDVRKAHDMNAISAPPRNLRYR